MICKTVLLVLFCIASQKLVKGHSWMSCPRWDYLKTVFPQIWNLLARMTFFLRKTVYDKYYLHCCRPFDTYPDKAGDTTGPCEKWYKGEDSSDFSKKSILISSVWSQNESSLSLFPSQGATTDVLAGDRLKVRLLILFSLREIEKKLTFLGGSTF